MVVFVFSLEIKVYQISKAKKSHLHFIDIRMKNTIHET